MSDIKTDINTVALTEQQQESEAIVNRLISTGKQIDIDLPETLEAQKEWALKQYDKHLFYGIRMGYALHAINQQMEHGEFTGWMEANNIKKRNAYNYMKVAKFLSGLDQKCNGVALLEKTTLDPDQEDEKEIDAILAKVIELPLRKQIELTKETPQRIRGYFEDGLFDEINQMNPGQIRTVIRQQKEIESMLERNRKDGELIQEKHEQLEQLKQLPEHHPLLQEIRNQLLQDMELVQGAMLRARKSYELVKDFQQELEFDAKEAVVFPLLHMLNSVRGNALLLAKDCWGRWDIDGSLPISPPMPAELNEQSLWLAKDAAAKQTALTAAYLELSKHPKKGKK